MKATCAWCDEYYFEENGCLTEDGKYHCCSEECLSNIEQNLAENAVEERYQKDARYRL